MTNCLLLTRVALLLLASLMSTAVSWSSRGDRSGLLSGGNVSVSHEPGVGYTFFASESEIGSTGGRGMVLLPEDAVPPEAYASYARDLVAKSKSYVVVILETPSESLVLKVMKRESWRVSYWVFAGHGKGGEVATELITTIEPKVRSLVLIGAALPDGVDLRSTNLFVAFLVFGGDSRVSPESVTDSLSRLAGDATFLSFPDLNHFDFLDEVSASSPRKWLQSRDGSQASNFTDSDRSQIEYVLLLSVGLSHWPVATEKALSYGDNAKLTPGQNDSKPYPGAIRVKFSAVPIPDTLPQRVWSVFTPSEVKGGLIYYPGAAVEHRAYWPLAFEIAARGYLVVVVQQPTRNALSSFTDANTVIDSNLGIFSQVAKSRWAIAGHSAGGSAASQYAAYYRERIFAAVLHAGSFVQNMSNSTLPFAQIYGTLDNVAGGYERYIALVYPYANLNTTKFFPILNGNHGQVGEYGYQISDQIATISGEEQRRILAELTVKFLDESSPNLSQQWQVSR